MGAQDLAELVPDRLKADMESLDDFEVRAREKYGCGCYLCVTFVRAPRLLSPGTKFDVLGDTAYAS